jgi:hypothetical protein
MYSLWPLEIYAIQACGGGNSRVVNGDTASCGVLHVQDIKKQANVSCTKKTAGHAQIRLKE